MRWIVLFALVACGTRTNPGTDDLVSNGSGSGSGSGGGGGGGGGSGTGTADASVVDAMPGCTMAQVMEAFGGTKQQCKMQITWTCGTTHYQIGLGCGEANPAGFGGACTKNGMSTGGMWNDTMSSEGCSCSDLAKTTALAAMKCGFPGPFEPN
jgi:hypothetical protein